MEKRIEDKNNAAILEALEDDGADLDAMCAMLQTDENGLAQIIRASAANGTLLWTKDHIVSTHSTCPFEYRF